MSVARKVFATTAIVYLGKILGILISTVTLGIIARNLGVERFGDYSAVLAFSSVVVSLADLGIGWLATREIALEKTESLRTLVTVKTAVTVVVVVGSLVALPVLGFRPEVVSGAFLVLGYTYFTAMNSLQVGILQGVGKLSKTAIADTAGRLLNLLGALLVMRLGYGLHAQLLAINVVGFAIYAVNAWNIWRVGAQVKGFCLSELKNLRKDLLTMPFVVVLSYLIYRIDMLILARLAPSLDVGIYAAAYRIIDVAVAVPSILVGALLPIYTRAIAAGDNDELQKLLAFGYSLSLYIGGLATVACVSFAHIAVSVIIGPDFIQQSTVSLFGRAITSVEVLQILALFLLLSFIGSLLSGIILAAKRQTAMIWVGLLGVCITVIGNLALIPRISYAGSAVLTVFTELCIVIAMIAVLTSSGWLRTFWRPLGEVLLATGISFAAVLVLPLYILPALYIVLILLLAGGERTALIGMVKGLGAHD